MQNSTLTLENNSTTEQPLLPQQFGNVSELPTGVAIERALNLLEMRREAETEQAVRTISFGSNR